ncbi:Fungal specific transcription factor [Rhizopus azygosporus]|uniref:Fungal specific transcription factor n=1 Tax=Rhizopus azygosporus TaxID=86630 RepID=A0A367JPI0_RHIAZ|nr:Fungal specific transcription factor [Rhizopus azygosporus]
MERLIQEAKTSETRKSPDIIYELEKNKSIVRRKQREYGILNPKQWLPGVKHDTIQYLGDLSTFQFLGSRLDLSREMKWEGYTIKRFGEDTVLVADRKEADVQQYSRLIPEIRWPKGMDPQGEDIHQYIYTVTGLDKHTAARLLKIYFANVHPILPVVDKTEFIDQYRGRMNAFPSGDLLNAMLGTAARFIEHQKAGYEGQRKLPSDVMLDVPMGWSNSFFDRAEHLLLNWSTTPTLSKIQTILLVLNTRPDRNIKSSESWQMGGFAHLLGLHKSCDHWDIPDREKETRKRVWWALYITDVFQTVMLGRGVNLRDEDIAVGYPDVTADWEEVMDAYEIDKDKILSKQPFPRFPSLSTPFKITASVGKRAPIYELFLSLVKLSQINSRILLSLHSPRARQFSYEHGSDNIVATLDHELTEWRYSFSRTVRNSKIPDFNHQKGYFAPAVASILLLYFSTLILLHQPFLKKIASKSSTTSQQICTNAAKGGMRIAKGMGTKEFLMCPYAAVTYPLRQFGLIQVINAKNPNPEISATAKEELKQGMILSQMIKPMSFGAYHTNKFYTILLNHLEEYEKSKSEYSKPNTNMGYTSQTVDAQQQQGSIEHSGTAPMNTGPFLFPTLSPFITAMNPNQSNDILHNKSEEAFSLSQFGFNTAMGTTSLNAFLQNTIIPGLDSYDMTINQQQLMNDIHTSNNMFRNDPSNLFWNLPLDVESLDNWLNNMNDIEWIRFEQ